MEALHPHLRVFTTDRRAVEANVNSRYSTRQRRFPPLCPSHKRAWNNIERRLVDNRSDQGGTTKNILGLSTTGSRAIETHDKPRDPIRQERLPPLCACPKQAGNNIERRLMDDMSDQGGTTATSS